MRPDTAVILCAGLGTRMRPLTMEVPKPLLALGGVPILAHALARLRAAGVRRIIVNAHHLAAQIAAFAASHEDVVLRHEPVLLDTGGAILAMRADGLLPAAPFYVVNGDSFWLDGPSDTLLRLAAGFDAGSGAGAMDAMLLLARAAGVMAETGMGDFIWPRDERLRRREERDVAPYLFAGVQLVAPALLDAAPAAPFSMNLLWDQALPAGRLGAIVHDGVWLHLSTPDDLAAAEEVLSAREVGHTT